MSIKHELYYNKLKYVSYRNTGTHQPLNPDQSHHSPPSKCDRTTGKDRSSMSCGAIRDRLEGAGMDDRCIGR